MDCGPCHRRFSIGKGQLRPKPEPRCPPPPGRDVLEGGEAPPPPLQGAQTMPSHCPPDGKCQLQWHLQPTVTAPNRFGTLL